MQKSCSNPCANILKHSVRHNETETCLLHKSVKKSRLPSKFPIKESPNLEYTFCTILFLSRKFSLWNFFTSPACLEWTWVFNTIIRCWNIWRDRGLGYHARYWIWPVFILETLRIQWMCSWSFRSWMPLSLFSKSS